MILVKLNEANFEYDIYSLLKAFYPQEDILVTAEPTQEMEQISFCLVIDYQNKLLTIRLLCQKEEAVYQDRIDYGNRKDTKNRLKRLMYDILKEHSKKELPWGTLTGIRPTKIPLGLLEQGKSREEILSYMQSEYEISEEKACLSYQVAKSEFDLLSPLEYEKGYSLYIGIPFCPSTCLYCSFTSYPLAAWRDKMDDYLNGLFREIDFVSEHLRQRRLHTIYIGGGTPTSLRAEQLDRLFTKLEQSFAMEQVLEFTVEAGRPDSITKEKLQVIYNHGIRRISINPQTMNQKTLDLIGRHHTVEQVRESFSMAREVGISCINMDLIVGLPGESIEDVEHTFEEIQKMNPDNLTVHSLALKRSARLQIEWDKYRNYQMENSDKHMELAKKSAEIMQMQPYYLYRQKNMTGNLENIGFAKKGMEGLYNVLIMEEKQTIIALGAGAACKYVTNHGQTVTRSENVKDVSVYLQRLDEMIERKKQKLEEIKWL